MKQKTLRLTTQGIYLIIQNDSEMNILFNNNFLSVLYVDTLW